MTATLILMAMRAEHFRKHLWWHPPAPGDPAPDPMAAVMD